MVVIPTVQFGVKMSSIDQSRAYLALREQITAVRREFGEDTGWRIVEQAVTANLNQLLHEGQQCTHTREKNHA
jgi:GAF domain-containing protein